MEINDLNYVNLVIVLSRPIKPKLSHNLSIMNSDMRKYAVGSQTPHGKIKTIYRSTKDWVVFQNDENNLKVFTDRKDQNYINAVKISKRLSYEWFDKLKGTHKDEFDAIIAACFVDALDNIIENSNIEKYFQSAKDYIKKAKRVKSVICSGPAPYHKICLMSDSTLLIETGDIPNNIKPAYSELHSLLQIINTYIPKLFRKGLNLYIGAAYGSIIRSVSETNEYRNEIIKTARHYVEKKVKEQHYINYISINSGLILLFTIIYHFIPQQISNIDTFFLIGSYGGIVGALTSSLLRINYQLFDVYDSRLKLILQSLSLVVIGFFSGILLVALSKSNIAFGFVEGNIYKTFVFSFLSGFSERFIPILASSLDQRKS